MRGTSLEAFASIRDSIPAMNYRVYRQIKQRPRTDEELFRLTGLAPNTCRPRRIELVELGLVRDSGKRKATKSGRAAIAWEAVPR